jgi:hypothetical protein
MNRPAGKRSRYKTGRYVNRLLDLKRDIDAGVKYFWKRRKITPESVPSFTLIMSPDVWLQSFDRRHGKFSGR